MQQLIGDLQKAEERCVLLEAEVREEVADEMAQVGGRGKGQDGRCRALWLQACLVLDRRMGRAQRWRHGLAQHSASAAGLTPLPCTAAAA